MPDVVGAAQRADVLARAELEAPFDGAQVYDAAVTLACGILTYGGVSLFVAFAIYPIAAALFREAGLPKRLIAGAIAMR